MMHTSRFLFALAAASVCSAAVQAAAPNNAGHIYFRGDITATSCTAGPGLGAGVGNGEGDILVNMGNVTFDDIGTVDSPNLVAAKRVNVTVTCSSGATGLDTVHMTLSPESGGTGADIHAGSILANTGTATGVGIGVVKEDDSLLDIRSEEPIDAPLVATNDQATGNVTLRAAYIRNGETLSAGSTVSSVPFVLTYE